MDPILKLSSVLDLAICLSDEPSKHVWIQIAKAGRFVKDGRAFELNARVFDEMVANFNAAQNHTIQIDFEHASEEPASELGVDGAPAQGWVHQLDNRERKTPGAGLWAYVEWLEPARSYIKAKKYKFISPAFRLQTNDRQGKPVGAALSSVALTNDPFLDGMVPVAAKARPAKDTEGEGAPGGGDDQPMMDPHEFMRSFKTCMSLHPLATHEECLSHCERLRKLCEMTNHPSELVAGVRPSDHLEPLRQMMRMSATSSPNEILDEVKKMIHAAIATHERMYHGVKATNADGTAVALTGKEGSAMNELDQAKKEISDLKATNAEKELELNKLKSASADKDKEIETLKKSNKEILDKVENDRVSVAFDDHKDAQKLTEDHKEMMLLTLRSNPAKFEKLYPRVPAGEKHMLRRIAPPAGNGNSHDPKFALRAAGSGDPEADDTEALCAGDFAVHVDAYRLKNKGVSLEDANEAVYHIRLVNSSKG